MSGVPSYPKVAALGHRAVADIFDGEVEITEKLDGSQFAFGVVGGELYCRSKGRQIPIDSVTENDLFYPVITYVRSLAEAGRILENVWFYGETLKSPKHSTLRYNHIPHNHFALFGAVYAADERKWAPHTTLEELAAYMDVGVVQLLDVTPDPESILLFLSGSPESQLGGAPMEGVVVKNYSKEYLYGPTLFPIMTAKYVSEEFKEVHAKNWKAENTGKGKWSVFKEQFATEARWQKSIQHMAEAGTLLGEPKDIGQLMIEVQKDIGQECKEEILRFLWKEFGKELLRDSVRGLPEWYKQQIALGNVRDLIGE